MDDDMFVSDPTEPVSHSNHHTWTPTRPFSTHLS